MPPWKKTLLTATLAAMLSHAAPAAGAEVDIPVLVPVTGFLALEGTSQRNGAVLAIRHAAEGLQVHGEVIDTGTSPEGAVTALERASGRSKPSGGRRQHARHPDAGDAAAGATNTAFRW